MVQRIVSGILVLVLLVTSCLLLTRTFVPGTQMVDAIAGAAVLALAINILLERVI